MNLTDIVMQLPGDPVDATTWAEMKAALRAYCGPDGLPEDMIQEGSMARWRMYCCAAVLSITAAVTTTTDDDEAITAHLQVAFRAIRSAIGTFGMLE